jgi:hypothetical protein
MLIDESFWWSKKLSVGRRDPKRIQRRLRTTQNSQRQLRTLRRAAVDRERENIKSSQNSVKMTLSQRAHRNLSNDMKMTHQMELRIERYSQSKFGQPSLVSRG